MYETVCSSMHRYSAHMFGVYKSGVAWSLRGSWSSRLREAKLMQAMPRAVITRTASASTSEQSTAMTSSSKWQFTSKFSKSFFLTYYGQITATITGPKRPVSHPTCIIVYIPIFSNRLMSSFVGTLRPVMVFHSQSSSLPGAFKGSPALNELSVWEAKSGGLARLGCFVFGLSPYICVCVRHTCTSIL